VLSENFKFLSEAETLLYINNPHSIILDNEQYYLYETFYRYEENRYLIYSLFNIQMNIDLFSDFLNLLQEKQNLLILHDLTFNETFNKYSNIYIDFDLIEKIKKESLSLEK
jgi:hypothetical protein